MTGARRRPADRERKAPPPNARRAALQGLVAIELGKRDRLRDAVDMRGLADRDRDFAWELAQGTERLHLFLDFVLSQFVDRRLPKVAIQRCVLRLGAYQLLMLSRVPHRAAVHETVALLRDRGFANAVLRQLARHLQARPASADAPRSEVPLPDGPQGARCLVFPGEVLPPSGTAEYLAVRYGLPPFLVSRWVEAHGFAAAARVCLASVAPPAIYLRPTHRLAEGSSLAEVLAAQGVVTEPLAKESAAGLVRVVSGSPFATAAFEGGLFLAQDPTAYAAARAVQVETGDRVLDLCAAPGTKTMVLAEALGGQGTVFAMDAARHKLGKVRDNAQRLGLGDRVAYPGDEEDFATDPVDRVLVDAPCSNSGVLARRVEVRRRISVEAIAALQAIQLDCLARGVRACRKGGTVVYSTCSVEPEENRQVVDRILGGSGGCELVVDRLTLPDPDGGDGGYYAVLRKT